MRVANWHRRARSTMTQQPSKCIFCGSAAKLTGEHIWSRWMRHYIPKSMPHYRSLRVTSHRAQSDFKVFKRRGDIQDWKVRCVCEKCNNGWMRASIDEPARPIMVALIDGAQARIMPEDQRKIASWAVLKAMVAEYDAGAYVTTRHMQRKYLMRRHVPPTKGCPLANIQSFSHDLKSNIQVSCNGPDGSCC